MAAIASKLLPMPTLYNRIANQSLDRLCALSDGVFAFAMTLLVLDLPLSSAGAVHSDHELWWRRPSMPLARRCASSDRCGTSRSSLRCS